MGRPLSVDLRTSALAAVNGELSRRAAARRSRRIEERRAEVMAALEEEVAQTLEEFRDRLGEQDVVASTPALSGFFQRHRFMRK
jgi:hypothetical protein